MIECAFGNLRVIFLSAFIVLRAIGASDSVMEIGKNEQLNIRAGNIDEINNKIQELPLSTSNLQEIRVYLSSGFVINSSIDLTRLTAMANYSVQLVLKNFNGFFLSDFQIIKSVMNSHTFFVLNSGSFDFYGKDGRLLDSCDSYLKDFHNLNDEQFSNSNKSDLIERYDVNLLSINIPKFYILGYVKFKAPICPIIFKNGNVADFSVFNLENSALVNNQFKFVDLNEIYGVKTNLKFQALGVSFIQLYRISIDRYLLNRDIFWQTCYFQFQGIISFIAEEAFKSLSMIKIVYLVIYEMRRTLHSSSGNKWLSTINYGNDFNPELWPSWTDNKTEYEKKANLAAFIYFMEKNAEYDFPERDFCLFREFPHRQLVFGVIFQENLLNNGPRVIIKEKDLNKLGCTFLYLTLYLTFLTNSIPHEEEMPSNYLRFKNDYNEFIHQMCNFSALLEMCSNLSNEFPYKSSHTTNLYDTMYIFQWVELVGPIITFPVVCLLGFVFNLIIALVIQNKHNQTEFFKGDRMYQYMLMNSIFNMIECLISVFVLLSECLGPNSLFCSALMDYQVSAYFKIYGVQYLGECMKTCSILTLIAFSMERYILTSNSDKSHKILNRFKRIDLRYFVAVMIIFSLATCVCKNFESTTESIGFESLEYPIFSILHNSHNILFLFSYILHYTLNDVVLLFANFLIDLKLFIVLRQHLLLKRKTFTLSSCPMGRMLLRVARSSMRFGRPSRTRTSWSYTRLWSISFVGFQSSHFTCIFC